MERKALSVGRFGESELLDPLIVAVVADGCVPPPPAIAAAAAAQAAYRGFDAIRIVRMTRN